MGDGPVHDFVEPDRARFLEVNRTRIRAWCWGDPSAPPVLFVHGAHDHGRTWDEFAPRVAALGFHAVAVDVRGHGDSGAISSGMFWSASTIDLCEVARVLAEEAGTPGEPIGAIGHSMGAGQVVTAAGTAPDRFAWLVLLDGLGPPPEAFEEVEPVEAATNAVDRLVKVGARPRRVWPSRSAMARRRGQTNQRLPRAFLDHLVEHGSTETEGGFVWKTDPLLNTGVPDGFSIDMIVAEHHDVTAPVLALMSSVADTWSDLDDDEIERRIASFPDARWESVPGAGHYVHVEQPDAVLDGVRSFLVERRVLVGEHSR